MMATRKQDIVAEVMDHTVIRVYSDLTRDQLESIEGVTTAVYFLMSECYRVHVDPRYDINEIRAEIVALATTEPKDA